MRDEIRVLNEFAVPILPTLLKLSTRGGEAAWCFVVDGWLDGGENVVPSLFSVSETIAAGD